MSLRRVFAWIGLAFIAILFAVWQQSYLYNFIYGPFPLSEIELQRITDPSILVRRFAIVIGSSIHDIGMQEITIRTRGNTEVGRSVSGSYYALQVGNRMLVVKSSAQPNLAIKGELLPMSAGLEQHLFANEEVNRFRAQFYPMVMDTGNFRISGYFGIAAYLALAVLLVRYGLPSWRQLMDLQLHPSMQLVKSWGDPIKISMEAEHEFRNESFVSGGGTWIMPHYLLHKALFGFTLLRVKDVLWAYKTITKHYTNFIPTGKSFQAVVVCYGGTVTLTANEEDVDKSLQFLKQRVPWAIFGHTPELEKGFTKDAKGFCSRVESRKAEFKESARSV